MTSLEWALIKYDWCLRKADSGRQIQMENHVKTGGEDCIYVPGREASGETRTPGLGLPESKTVASKVSVL